LRVSISSLGGHLKTGQRALPRTRTSPTFPSVWGLDQKMRLGCHQINDQTGGRPLALPKTTEMAWKVATLRVCLGIPGFDRMRSRRRIEENPGCFSNRGLFMGGPDQRSSNHQEHPGRIGAGCPVFPCETRADGRFDGLSPAGLSLGSLPQGVLYLRPLLSRPRLLQLPLPGTSSPPAAPPSQSPPSTNPLGP